MGAGAHGAGRGAPLFPPTHKSSEENKIMNGFSTAYKEKYYFTTQLSPSSPVVNESCAGEGADLATLC